MKSSKLSGSLVKCPFCDKQVNSRELADHAKQHHARDENAPLRTDQTDSKTIEAYETKSVAISGMRHYFIDESGILINPSLVEEEQHPPSRREGVGVTDSHKGRKTKFKKPKELGSQTSKGSTSSIDEAFQEKLEWLENLRPVHKSSNVAEMADRRVPPGFNICPVCKVIIRQKNYTKHLGKVHPDAQLPNQGSEEIKQATSNPVSKQQKQGTKRFGSGWQNTQVSTREFRKSLKKKREVDNFYSTDNNADPYQEANLVKCPLCKHMARYNVLFVHLQVSHPEVNPKIVMAKFNKVNKSKDYGNLSRYQDELNELVKDYERLKQGQDEPRDGGKYMGYMRREQGKFGSLPLYDDYSDEADAE